MRRLIIPSFKSIFLLAAVGALFFFWHAHIATSVVMPDDDDISVSPRVMVQVGKISLATLHQYLNVYGIVEAEPAREGNDPGQADLSVPTTAIVLAVNCVEGQPVKKGQVLLELDDREANAAIDSAQRLLAAAVQSVGRNQKGLQDRAVDARELLRALHEQDVAQSALDAAQARRKVLDIDAPISGNITRLLIHPGETAVAGVPVVSIVDPHRLVIAASVPAGKLAAVKVGQAVEMDASPSTLPTTLPAEPMGKVVFVDPNVDAKTGMGSVDVSIPATVSLKPGQFARVRIITEEHRDCLSVPVDSVVTDARGQANISMVVRDFRWAIHQPVAVGIIENNRVEISGINLAAGQDIVTTGAYALTDKCRIEVEK